MKLRLAVLAMLLATPGYLFAGTACDKATIVPADGRIVDFDFVAASGDNFYQVDVTQGHSYSFEVRQNYDDKQPMNDLQTELFAVGNTTCTGALIPNPAAGSAVRDTTGIDPKLPANSFRVSTTPSTAGTMRIKVHNNNETTGRYISVSVADTTQFTPLYTTFSGFNALYRFFNTTNQPISGKITLFTPSGAVSGSATFVVPANTSSGTVSTAAGGAPPNIGLGVAPDNAGPGTYSHDGPPGAILIDGFALGSNAAGFVTFPITFRPVRDKQ